MTHALEKWRSEFPILESTTYLASHSLGAAPRATAAALAEYYELWARRGIQAWDGPWWEAVLDFGKTLEGILHASAGTVAPLQNATRAMAAVASCLNYRTPRNRVVMTDLEFTTHYPFWRAQESLGAELVIVPSPDRIDVPTPSLCNAIDHRTLLVATSHAYFRSGAVQDLAALTRTAHERGAMVLADAYQTVGAVPLDASGLGIDFIVGGCHKWLLGGAGAGYLYVRKDLIPDLRPRLTGWFGLDNPFHYRPGTDAGRPHPGILRFLDGTPNVPALYAAREGTRLIRTLSVDAIRRVSLEQTRRILEWAARSPVQVRTPTDPARRNGMVCLDFARAKEATEALVRQGIIVDWRPDCGLRVSPHFYNNAEDLDRFFRALEREFADAPRPRPAGIQTR